MTASTILKQGVQTLTLDDINPHDLYTHQDQPLINGPIDMLYDTGASITMLPLDYTPAWRNLRPCLHQLTGCFGKEGTQDDLQIGEFHGLLKLDSDEVIRVVIPEAIALPADTSSTYLLSDTQFLLAGYQYKSDLREPKIVFQNGGEYTMAVKAAHKVIGCYQLEQQKRLHIETSMLISLPNMIHLRTATTLSTQNDPTHKLHPHISGTYATRVRARKCYKELVSTSRVCKYK